MIHGDTDEVVSADFMLEAKDFFIRNNIEVESHLIKNCGHHIPIEASSIALNYILKNFSIAKHWNYFFFKLKLIMNNFLEQDISLEKCPALVLNADYRPLSYYPLSLWSWQDTVKSVFLV